jgi:hypothetical protein
MFINFWDLLLLKEGGKWVWGLFIKNHFVLLTFLIVCKFFVFFFFTFKGEKGGHGFKVNKYNLYSLD